MLMIAIWSSFPLLTTVLENNELQLLAARFLYVAAAFVPFSFLYLTITVLESPPSLFESKLIKTCAFLSCAFSLLSFHPDYIRSVGTNGNCRYVVGGSIFPFFVGYFIFVCGWTFYRLLVEYPRARGLKRNQLRYFFTGFSFAYVAGAIHFATSLLKSEILPHDLLVAAFTLVIGYAILRYRLMDFNLIVRLALAHVVFLFILCLGTLPLIAATEWVGNHLFKWQRGFTTVIVISGLVLVFESLRKRVTRFVDLFIFRSKDFQSILDGFEQVLANRLSIEQLCEALAGKLKELYGTEHAGVLVWDFHTSTYQLYPVDSFTDQLITRFNRPLLKTDFLVRTLESERRLFWQGIVVEDEITDLGNRSFPGERTTFWKIRRTMRWLGAHICIPVMLEKDLRAIIILGRKRSESIYNREDKRFLTHLSELTAHALGSFSFSQPGTIGI